MTSTGAHLFTLLFVQITVSSGGMLLMKLDPNDLQFENYTNFDGSFAYAQNKVTSVQTHRNNFPDNNIIMFNQSMCEL